MAIFGFGGDSKSSQSSTQQTTSTAGANSPSTGTTGAKSSINTGLSINVGSKGTLNETSSDPATIQQSFQTVNRIFDSAVKTIADTVNQSNKDLVAATGSVNTLASTAIQSQADLAKSNATGGTSNLTKPITIVAVAIVILLAVIFFFRK